MGDYWGFPKLTEETMARRQKGFEWCGTDSCDTRPPSDQHKHPYEMPIYHSSYYLTYHVEISTKYYRACEEFKKIPT